MIHIVMCNEEPVKAFYSEETANKMVEDLNWREERDYRGKMVYDGFSNEYIDRHMIIYRRSSYYTKSVEIS